MDTTGRLKENIAHMCIDPTKDSVMGAGRQQVSSAVEACRNS